jgi:hypothetical protein
MGVKSRIISLLTIVAASLSLNPAQAHAPVAPLPIKLSALKSLPLAHHLLAYSARIPGLSGASSAFYLRNRAIVTNGISAGYTQVSNQAFLHALQGPISSGLLKGTFYESFNGANSYAVFPNYVLAFGNNSLSLNGGVPSGQVAPSSLINAISFGAATPTPVSIVHGIIIKGAPTFFHESGSERAALNQIKNLNVSSYSIGTKLGNQAFPPNSSNSPIVAGSFYGTDYYQPNLGVLTYDRNATYLYAFGSNSYNTSPFLNVLPNSAFRNYIQLANGQVYTYSAGLLPASGYFAGNSLDNNWLFSLGKDQYNFFNNFLSAPASIFFNKLPSPYLLF